VGIYQGVKGLILSPYNGTRSFLHVNFLFLTLTYLLRSMFITKIREGYGATGGTVTHSRTYDSVKSRLLAEKDAPVSATGDPTLLSPFNSSVNALDCEDSPLPFAMNEKDARHIKLTKAYNKVLYIRALLKQLHQVQKEQKGRTTTKGRPTAVGLNSGMHHHNIE